MAYAFRSSRRPGQRPQRQKPAKNGHGQYIDPKRFVRKAVTPVVEEAPYEPTHQFIDFEVEQFIKDNLTAKGYKLPTPIQDQAIPLGLQGKDVIGIANTGTGKTAAFGIPLVHRLVNDRKGRALVIAPTRELAMQIKDELRTISTGSKLYDTLLIGGAPMNPQLRDLKKRPHIVIGTPGRIKDHIQQKTLDLSNFNFIVLDEVDRMLDMGFLPDVRFILSHLHAQRQSFFFSATMDDRVRGLIDTFSENPVTVSVKTGDTSAQVEQDVVFYRDAHERMEKLRDLLNKPESVKVIIFHATQRNADRLHKKLVEEGFNADAIHGGKTQGQRKRALDRFKTDGSNILVATDVAARGIDVTGITHVINFAQPNTYEDYVHRIGRAGRAGRTGYAFTFVERLTN